MARKRAREEDDEGEAGPDDAMPPLYRAAEAFFDAQEAGSAEGAEASYRAAIALCAAGGLAPAAPQRRCELQLPAVPDGEGLDGADELPPRAVLASAAHNALAELILDRALAGCDAAFPQARAEFEAAVRWWPANAAAAVSLATMERDCGRFASAVRLYARAAALPLPAEGHSSPPWAEDWVVQPRRCCVPVATLMLALLRSQLGDHAAALQPIQRFGFRQRIAPAVWAAAHAEEAERAQSAAPPGSPVRMFAEAVPQSMAAQLADALAPDAAYWRETGYDTREYFSWFFDLRGSPRPSNTVEALIMRLLPLVESVGGCKMVGAEWWTHTRPAGRNVGHQLHYDLEEGILEATGDIVHPAVSSVVYLSGGEAAAGADTAGPTLVLDQRVDDVELAARGWLAHPVPRALLTFPGDRLHGVLPGKPTERRDKRAVDAGPRRRKETERLTLMIAWWAVPTRERCRRKPIGAQARFPRASRRCSFAQQLSMSDDAPIVGRLEDLTVQQLESPWAAVGDGEAPAERLEVPHHVDQRFFVHSAQTVTERLFAEHR